MNKSASVGKSEWIDPDDAPELTEELLDRAEIWEDGRIIRRGRPPIPNPKQLVTGAQITNIRPIRTESDYSAALRTIDALLELDLADGSAELDALDVISTLVEHYEAEHHAISLPDPIAAIELRMAEYGFSQRELARITNMQESKISEVLSRKRSLSLSMIRAFSTVLRLPEAVLVQEYPLEPHPMK